MCEYYLYHIFKIYLSIDENVYHFHFLAAMNNATMYIVIKMLVSVPAINFFFFGIYTKQNHWIIR